MKQLCVGFFLGIFLKQHFVNIGINIVKNGLNKYYSIKKPKVNKKDDRVVTKIELVIKIKNAQYCKDIYPDYKYYDTGLYKYTFPEQIIEYVNNNVLETDVKTLCDLNYLHNYEFDILSQIGEMYLYITHNGMINVYTPGMVIRSSDFVISESPFKNIICCTLYYDSKTEYITKYIKKFTKQELTLETILLNYHLQIELLNCKVSILDLSGKLLQYSITDKLI
jgi:hypothetical protein